MKCFVPFLLLACLVCSLPLVQAQSITVSEDLPLRHDYAYTIMGWVDNDLLLFRDKGHQFFVQAFDEELRLRWEREIWLGDRRCDIIDVITHNDKFHVLYGMRDRGEYHLLHRMYSHEVELLDSGRIDMLTDVFISPRISLVISEDKSHVLVYREENAGLKLYSYDLNEKRLLWTGGFQLTGTSLVRNYRAMTVSNTGEFYLALEPDKFLQRVQHLEILSSTDGTGQINQEKISLGEVQVYDYQVVYDNVNHNLVLTGMYSDRNSSRALGFYFTRYRPGGVEGVHTLPFDEALLAEVHGREVSSTRGLSDFNVQKVALRQDGGVIIIAELNKEFSRRSSLPMRRDNGAFARAGWVDYYYEDLILFAIHPDGTPHWKKVLRKRQYSQDDDAIYSSFFLFLTPSRLRFLFNDEIKQENTVGGYEVSGTGYVERKTVFNTDYQRLKLRFKDGLQVAYNECIVPSERSNRLNLVRIQFAE